MDENEAKVQAAIDGYLTKKYKSITKAAKAFNVPASTIKHRVRGRQTRVQSHQHQQLLTEAEEDELVQRITQLTSMGHVPGFSFVREMAEELRRQGIRPINDDGLERVSYLPIGKNWVNRFLKRHPQLKSVVGRAIDASRIKDVTKEVLMTYFNDVRKVFDEHKIDMKNLYNMDESGFTIGKISATRIITNAKLRTKYQAQPGRQEWVSVVECICTDGTSIPSLVIFRGENLSSTWIPANISTIWKFSRRL